MHEKARAFEHRLAEDLDATRIQLSGAGHEKADVRRGARYKVCAGELCLEDGVRLRIEAKTTGAPNYTFRVQDWADLVKSADSKGENPVFAICFLPAAATTYRQSMQLVLVRAAFAAELELVSREPAVPMDIVKSWALNYNRLRDGQQRRCIAVRTEFRRDVLVLLDYDTFLAALARYEEDGKARAGYAEYRRST